jgi:hypothetical protein
MLSVTNEASKVLQEMISDADVPDGGALRLVQRDTGLGFAIDQPRENDHTFAHKGTVVLVVAEDIGEALGDKTLRVQQAEQGVALVIE